MLSSVRLPVQDTPGPEVAAWGPRSGYRFPVSIFVSSACRCPTWAAQAAPQALVVRGRDQ